MKLSVVMPAYNEEGCIRETICTLNARLQEEEIDYELIVVNDNSKDNTENILIELSKEISELKYFTNYGPNGFGYAIRYGLDKYSGDCVAIMMADLSDSPSDLVKFYNKMQEGYDCVFGTRWSKGGKVIDYPFLKRIINRMANWIVKITLRLNYDDCTNAFKLYRRETIDGVKPFLSHHFNLTLELPLKAIVRGYSYAILPNSWQNRKTGESKLKIREMGSRYFFIMLYCLIEKYFSKGDYMKKEIPKEIPLNNIGKREML